MGAASRTADDRLLLWTPGESRRVGPCTKRTTTEGEDGGRRMGVLPLVRNSSRAGRTVRWAIDPRRLKRACRLFLRHPSIPCSRSPHPIDRRVEEGDTHTHLRASWDTSLSGSSVSARSSRLHSRSRTWSDGRRSEDAFQQQAAGHPHNPRTGDVAVTDTRRSIIA